MVIFFTLHLFTLLCFDIFHQTPGRPDCGICGWATGPLYLTAACCGAKHHAQCLQVCYTILMLSSIMLSVCRFGLDIVVDVDPQSVDVVVDCRAKHHACKFISF